MKAYEREMLLAMARVWDMSDGPGADMWRTAARQLRASVNKCEIDTQEE